MLQQPAGLGRTSVPWRLPLCLQSWSRLGRDTSPERRRAARALQLRQSGSCYAGPLDRDPRLTSGSGLPFVILITVEKFLRERGDCLTSLRVIEPNLVPPLDIGDVSLTQNAHFSAKCAAFGGRLRHEVCDEAGDSYQDAGYRLSVQHLGTHRPVVVELRSASDAQDSASAWAMTATTTARPGAANDTGLSVDNPHRRSNMAHGAITAKASCIA